MSTHIMRWLEAAAKHLVEEAIVGGSRDVAAHFEADGGSVVIIIERTPVRIPRGHLSLINDGVWLHSDDFHQAKCGESPEFERASAYSDRASMVEPLALFLQQKLGEQTVIDLHMEGTDGDRNTCFEVTMFSDDGVSFQTGAIICGLEEAGV